MRVRCWPSLYGLFQMVNPVGVMVGMVVLTATAHRIRHRGRFMLQSLAIRAGPQLVRSAKRPDRCVNRMRPVGRCASRRYDVVAE